MEAVLDFGWGCQNWLKSCYGECVERGGGSDKHCSPSAGHEVRSSPRLHSCWPRSVYQFGVSFLSFHLSPCRKSCTVVDKNAHTIGARQYFCSSEYKKEDKLLKNFDPFRPFLLLLFFPTLLDLRGLIFSQLETLKASPTETHFQLKLWYFL